MEVSTAIGSTVLGAVTSTCCRRLGRTRGGFNGSLDAPTFTPSVLVHSHKALDDQGRKVDTPRCHSYVTDGRIQYLSDTTHALSGQTVDLPEVGNTEASG